MAWSMKRDLVDLRGTLSPTAFLVRYVMRACRDRKTGIFYRSKKWLSKTTGISYRCICMAVNEIENHRNGATRRGCSRWYMKGSKSTVEKQAKFAYESAKYATFPRRSMNYPMNNKGRSHKRLLKTGTSPTPISNIVQVIVQGGAQADVKVASPAKPPEPFDPTQVTDPTLRKLLTRIDNQHSPKNGKGHAPKEE